MSRTVLVVDDEPDILLAARLMLEAVGCIVIEAASGEAALELVEAEEPDVEVMFLDLRMPGLDGWGVLKELRAKGISAYTCDRLVRLLRPLRRWAKCRAWRCGIPQQAVPGQRSNMGVRGCIRAAV